MSDKNAKFHMQQRAAVIMKKYGECSLHTKMARSLLESLCNDTGREL
jgi:hypothetical protein